MFDPLTDYLSGITTDTPPVATLAHSVESAIARRLLASLPDHDRAVVTGTRGIDPLAEHLSFALDLGGPAGVVAQYAQALLPDHDQRVLASVPQLVATA